MNGKDNKNSVDKINKKGQDALKTGFFSFKFKPDYLSAVSYFTDAAAGYKKLKMYNESLKAYEDAIKCNKELLESWAEAQNWQEMADICIFDLSDFNTGWKYLKNSSLSYKLSGKFTSGIKVYTDFSQRLIEINKCTPALTILKEAVDDCFEHTHDELVRISLEESFNKIIDVYCYLENYVDAINLIEKYVKMQITLKDETKHKISKNYLKLGMLRIIIGEIYMSENLIDEMFTIYHSSFGDDIEDLRMLNKSFREGNKKDFNFLVTYSFSLFQNNLLKSLKKAFDKILEQQMNSIPSQVINTQIINLQIDELSIDETSTTAQSEMDLQTEINNNNEVSNSNEYL